MKRTATTIAVLVGVLLVPTGAEAATTDNDVAGFNGPTRRLEASFTTALTARINGKSGCYPSVRKLVQIFSKRKKTIGAVSSAKNVGSAREPGVVYVLRNGTSCNGITASLRDRNVTYVLDSIKGEIKILGGKKGKDPAIAHNRGPLRNVSLVTRGTRITQPNNRVRLEAKCPGRTFPLGGGFVSNPALEPNGEGVYPHSFERLGAQRGFHVTAWYYTRDGRDKGRIGVGVQVVCGLGLAPLTAPHATTFTKPGETKTVTARCPSGQYLLSGGFQRTDFLGPGGNYVTESRAVGAQAWTATARAYGEFGGELTAIAYCTKASGPLLTEVASQPVPVGWLATATATTAQCPPGQVLSTGGFSNNGTQDTWFAGGRINDDNTWTAQSFGRFASINEFTAYGYCLTPGV